MKNDLIRKISLAIAVLVLVPLISACGQKVKTVTREEEYDVTESGSVQSGGSASGGTTTGSNTTSNASTGSTDTIGSVKNAITDADMPKINLTNKVVTMHYWTTWQFPQAPFKNRFKEVYGGELKIVNGDINAMVAAGNPPDIYYASAQNTFPAVIKQGMVQPWDPYIAYDNKVWKGIDKFVVQSRIDLPVTIEDSKRYKYIDFLKWDGKVYVMTEPFHNLGVLFYNKKMIKDAGLTDPVSLQSQGKWTWSEFKKQLGELTDTKNGTYGLVNNGKELISAAFISTGEDTITYNNQTFKNNLKNSKIAYAADWLRSLNDAGVMIANDSTHTPFKTGKAAFIYTNDWQGLSNYKDMWGTYGLGIVPFPKCEKADKQYQVSLADHIYLMKNAKNPQGAGAFLIARAYDNLLNQDAAAANDPIGYATNKIVNETKLYTAEAAKSLIQIPINYPRTLATSWYIGDEVGTSVFTEQWPTIVDRIFTKVELKIKTIAN